MARSCLHYLAYVLPFGVPSLLCPDLPCSLCSCCAFSTVLVCCHSLASASLTRPCCCHVFIHCFAACLHFDSLCSLFFLLYEVDVVFCIVFVQCGLAAGAGLPGMLSLLPLRKTPAYDSAHMCTLYASYRACLFLWFVILDGDNFLELIRSVLPSSLVAPAICMMT